MSIAGLFFYFILFYLLMNQKITQKRTKRKNLWSPYQKRKKELLESLINNPNLSDEERFNQYLQVDLRLNSSYTQMDLETERILRKVGDQFKNFYDSMSGAQKAIRDYQQKFFVPPEAVLVFAAPLVGFYLANRNVHTSYQYRLPSSMPGLSMVCKKATVMDWSTVVGTQFFHKIDWKDVGVSLYRPDSAFVLFSPRAQFGMQEKYVALVTTGLECDSEPVDYVQAKNKGRTIDLVKVGKDSYAAPNSSSLEKENLAKRAGKTVGKKSLQWFRKKQKYSVPTMPSVSSEVDNFRIVKSIVHSPNSELKRLPYPRLRLFSLSYFSKPGYRPSYISRPKRTKSPKFPDKNNRVWVGNLEQRLHKVTPIPVLIDGKPKVKQQNIAIVKDLVASRDHHVLMPAEDVAEVERTIQKQLKKKTRNPFLVGSIKSQHYWQTFFTSLDLIPSRMESMTFPNQPKRPPKDQYLMDIKKLEKDTNQLQKAFILPEALEKRDTFEIPKYHEEIERRSKKKLRKQKRLEKNKPLKDAMIRVTPIEKPYLAGFNTNTARREKHALVAPDRHESFDLQHDNPYSVDGLVDKVYHVNMLRKNWENRIRETYDNNVPGWRNKNEKLHIPPLFNVKQLENSRNLLPSLSIKADTSSLLKQDRPAKIFLLSRAINDNFQKALNTRIAVRQSSRYQIYNSFFHFKNLLGRNYYNRRFPNVRPVEFLPDYILHPDNKKTDGIKTDGVKTLDGAFLYDVLVRESENFNIFANFPYTKRYEIEKSKNLLYSNNQLTEFESLDRDLKDYVVPLRKAATIKKLRLRRWWYKRVLWFLNFKRYKEVTFSDDQREPKHWSNWETTLKNQIFEEEKIQEFAPPKPSQQDMLEQTLLVGKLDLDNLELYEQKLKNEKTPFEEKAFTTLYNRCFKNYDVTSHQNLDMWQDRKRLKRIKHYFEKRRSYYCKNLMKTLYELRDVVSKKPVTPTSFDNYSAFKAWEKKKDAYNRKVSNLVANSAKIVRGKAVFEREEKAYAEMLIPVFEKMDYEKDFKVPRREEAPSFLRTLLPTDDPKRVQSNFISKQIQSDLVDKAMESYYVKNGRFLNKFDVSHHQAILRDFDKASLMTWRYTKDIKDIESSQGLEFYAPLELLDASLKRQLPEQATIQPYADKFDFDALKKEYRRFLISNPFRVVPNTQKALFTRVSRDIIENEAYQDYLNWYQHFFLRNVHFINPTVKLNQLDHLLEPNKLNAYKAYSKATKQPCWTEEELKTMPFNDEKVYQMLESQKKEAMVDHQEIKQRYINQVEKERAYKEEVKKDMKERRRKDGVNAKRQAVQEDGPNGLLLSELMPKEDYDLHPSEIEFLDNYRPDHFHSHRGLTTDEKKELRQTIREAKKLKRKLAKAARKLAKSEAKEEKRKENELNRLRTPEERRLEKQKKQEAKRKEKQRKKEQKRKQQEAKREVKRLLKRKQANEKRLTKALAATKNRQLINFSKNFDFTKPEYRQYFVEKYGKTALADVDREMELFNFRDKLIDKKERAASGTYKLSVSYKRKLAALFDKQLPIELRPSEEFDEYAEPEKFAKSKTRQMENLSATETPTYLDFFKEHLVYFLSPSKTIDPVYCERLLPDREVRDFTKLHEEATAKFGSDGPVKTEKPDLSEAYKEVAKSFGWAKKTPFDASKQEVTQASLNREIVNAFIRSQQAFRKSKVQKENEQTIRNKIRNRIVQGHSPYLKRCVSGYLNPDATFQEKFGELAGWDNVFEKVKHIYGLTKSRNTNLFSFAQLAFIQHWGRLSTINSPLYQLTSPSGAYHYECFGRLINRRTSQVLDFKQLNLHSVLKAGNPHRQLIPKYYYGNTTTTKGVPCYPGVPAEEDFDSNIIVDEKAFRKEKKRVARGKDVSLEQLLMKQAPVFKETLDPESADEFRNRRRYIDGGPLGLDGPFKDENDCQVFENYDNYFKYKGDMNHFKESATKDDDNYQDSDDNYQNSDEETLNVNNDRFYDSDDYNSDDSFDDHLSNSTLKNAQAQTKEEKRKEKLQKRKEKLQKRKEKRNERFQKRNERKRLKTQKVEMKENPIFDPYDENTARLFNRLKKKYKSNDYELKPDHVNAQRYQFEPGEEDPESPDQPIEDDVDFIVDGGLRPYASPLKPYPEIATYKARGLPKRVFIEEKSQELIDANALMNKVRHRWFDSQNFESSMSRVIDHSLFDYKYWEDSKWVFKKNLRSLIHPRPKVTYPFTDKRIYGFERARSKVMLNVSLTDPSFFGFLIVLWYMAKIAKRVKQDYQRTVLRGLTRFFYKLDFEALRSLTKLNEAIVRCQGIEFKNIVGGEKLLYLFYPLILWNRNKHFSFGTLPVFEYKLLQTLASGSPGFVLNNDQWEFNILKPTKKEIDMSRKLEQARNYMVQIEQQSCLLIGPPGTGKTFLVKALASESYLPVLIPTRYEAIIQLENVESSFENPDESLRMRQIFELANNKKPCILFLDEIDSMGQDRQDVLLDTSGPFIGPETLSKPSELVSSKAFNSWKNSEAISAESLNLDRLNYDYQTLANPVYGVEQLASQINDPEADLSILDTDSKLESQPGAKKVSAHAIAQLTQLLCLLDGTNQRHVLVIGATNRPQTLDPALTRPGRLNKIFYLDLPSKQKRLDLLKFYSRSRVTEPIDWDYFAKKTVGLSPAHLKAAMNLSALKTAHEMIEKQQTNHNKVYHSEASIEYGIESVSNTQSLAQGFIDQSTKKLNQLSVPLFFDDIGQMNLWQHVSLGSPIRPIVLPVCELSGITRTEKLPTKTETQVWNKIPDHIPRVSFPTLYKNVKTLAFQSLQGAGIKTTQRPKNVLSDEKRREGRLRFYQRHRLAWRSAYLLSDPETINYSLLDNVTIDDHPFVNGFYDSPLLDESSAEILTLFKQYVARMFRVHVLGSKLLLHSTYAADNPLMFKTEYIYKKVGNTVVRSSGQFTRFSSPTPLYLALLKEEPSLFMPPNKFETTQNKIFSHSLALQRSIAYNANKALMVHLLKDTYQQDHMYDIWNRVKYNANPEKYQKAFVKSVQENFVTRKQFENYLVALSAGKVGEHLMLFYRDALPKFDPLKPRFGRYTYDVSEIGRHELHQMSWLLNIMIEKNLFYSPSVDLSKQLLTTESYSRYRSKYNTSIAAVAANKELWTAFDKSTTILATETDQNPIVNKFLSLFVKPNTTYWWEPNGLDLPSPGNVGSISSWTSLFSTKKQISVQRMPANLNYDIYRPNVLRTASLLDSPFDAKYLPSSFVESVTKQGETWNQSSLNDTERLSRALLLDTFAKSFYILVGHRELCDHLSYHLVRSGKIQANQLKQISDTFLESAHRERFAQIEKDKEIDEQLGNVQKKK